MAFDDVAISSVYPSGADQYDFLGCHIGAGAGHIFDDRLLTGVLPTATHSTRAPRISVRPLAGNPTSRRPGRAG